MHIHAREYQHISYPITHTEMHASLIEREGEC
jgi:hypothetical protein